MASYNVAKLPNGRWRGRYRDASRKERSKVFDRKVDAERWGRSEVAKLDRGDWTDPMAGKVTVADYSEEWLASKVKIKLSSRTNYASLLSEHVMPTWGAISLAAVRHEEVAKWVRELADSGLSASRIRQAHIVLRQVLDMAVRARRISVNPAVGVELPSLPTKSERPARMLTEEQVWTLAHEAGDQSLPILVMAWCGLRFGEAAALTVHEFDAVRRELHVNRTLSEVGGKLHEGPPKTKASARTVPVPQWLASELAATIDGKGPSDRLLTMPDGGPLRLGNWRGRVFDPAIRPLGLPRSARRLAIGYT